VVLLEEERGGKGKDGEREDISGRLEGSNEEEGKGVRWIREGI
jgi:hypothetical protein